MSVSGRSADKLWVPACDFLAVQGFASPAVAFVNQRYGFNGCPFDAASTEINTVQVVVSGWNTMHVDFAFVNVAGGAGNVVYNAGSKAVTPASDYTTAPTMAGNATFAVTAANNGELRRLLTGVACGTSVQETHICLERVGGDAGDTYASDHWLAGALLTKAS